MKDVIVFDDGKGMLGPLCDVRPSFGVRTGALTNLERHALVLGVERGARLAGVWTTKPMVDVARETYGSAVNDESVLSGMKGAVLLINGRCVLTPEGVGEMKPGEAFISESGDVVAACMTTEAVLAFLKNMVLDGSMQSRRVPACMLERPWDVIRHRDAALAVDLDLLRERESQPLPAGVIGIEDDGIHISPEALVYPSVVLDAEHGDIVIDEGVTVRPGAVIIGPAYIGPGSTVADRSLIKGQTAIGPVCKVAGEVGGTIFQGFANKAHDGHLGDSWVGEWANLGAGTTNSNLLNTYGEVIAQVEPASKKERTGLTFLGCIVGDHVKTAIMTRIMTGSVFGTGSMIAASNPPTCVGRLEWLTDARRQPYRFEKFAEVAAAAMGRRKKTLSEAMERRLKSLAV